MGKVLLFLLLLTGYLTYSAVVYTRGTRNTVRLTAPLPAAVKAGKTIYEKYNCTSCHQLYGLGGFLGPELTTAYSDPLRGPLFMKAFLQGGGPRMPNFRFSEEQINSLLSYLQYVDSTAITYKPNRK